MFFEVILSVEFFFLRKKLKDLKDLNPSWISLKGLNFCCWKYDSKNWTFFLNLIQKLFLLFFFMIQILGPFSHDSKNWTFFFTWLKYLNFWKFLIQRNGPFFFFSGFKNFSSTKNNSQNWIFLNPTHGIDFFCELNRLISWIWRKELNRLISWIWRKDLNPFFFQSITQRIELFDEYDSKN